MTSLFHHYSETRILLHAKWSSFEKTQQNFTKFSAMLGEDEKMTQQNFKQGLSKFKKGYSQDLVFKQTRLHSLQHKIKKSLN